MKLREHICTVCHVILFKPKSFHLSHWGFQGQPQLLNYSFSAPLKHNQPDLPSSLSLAKYSDNSEWIYFQIPPCTAEIKSKRSEGTSKQIPLLSLATILDLAQQSKETSPDVKFQEQAPKIKSILSNTVNHSTEKSKQAKNCCVPSTACSQIM